MKKKIIAMLLALLSITSVLCTSSVSKAAAIHETDLEEYIQQELPKAHVLGMGISIVSADKELYCAAYGTAQNTEADYELGALSKSLTAVGIMRMVEDEDLYLEDTVSDYTSEYPEFGDITILELLNQTSGIAYEQTKEDTEVKGKKGRFEDANLNYNILGNIIENVSGMTYEEYISDNVLDPLEMASTYSLRHDPELAEEMVTGYQSYFGFPFPKKNEASQSEEWMGTPSSYMVSDIKDMGRYLQMYLKKDETVISKESIKTILRGEVDIPEGSAISEDMFGGSAKYGMGWIQKEVDGKKVLYASGRTENYTTAMVLLPKQDLGIVMMFNSSDSLVGDKFVEKLVEGVVSIELGSEPGRIDGNAYLVKHGIYDALMVFAIIAALVPIFVMGVWWKKRRQKLLNIPGIVADILINIVLPTLLLLAMPSITPIHILKKFIPDVYYVTCIVIASLYIGAVVKLIAMIVVAILGPKKEEKADSVEDDKIETAEASNTESEKAEDSEESEKDEDKIEESEESEKQDDKTVESEESDKSEAAATEESAEKEESAKDK